VDPNRIAVDPVHNELFVPEGEMVLVYPREANGNVAPIRVLKGADTQLGAEAIAVDPVRNLLVVSGSSGRQNVKFRVFNRTDQGNVKPKAVIGGPKSGLRSLGGPFTVYPAKGWIVASDRGEGGMASDLSYVGVWSIEDNGDVPPRWRIAGPKGVLQMPRGVVLDPKHKELIVTDKRQNAVLTFSFPEIF
jgi:DNA-binding beta-propeller fold protein YncE